MIRILAILLILPLCARTADESAITVAGIAQFSAAYQSWDGTGFAKAAATFKQAPDTFMNRYWLGTAEFHRLLFLLGEPGTPKTRQASAQALESATAALERVVQLNPGYGEGHALLGTVYGLNIAANPLRAVWLGPRVMDQEKQARALSPDNPRVFYLDGMCRFYGPSVLGGKTEALKLLLTAEKLFSEEAAKPAGPIDPRWGRSTCLVYIGRTYAALDKPAEAKEYFRKALEANPRDRLAQSELEKIK